MKTLLRSSLMLTLVCSGSAAVAEESPGDTYHCTMAGQVRLVEVAYADASVKLPCTVTYEKAGNRKVLWRAKNEVGYCEHKAATLALKLESFGFSCEKTAAAVNP